MKRAALWVAAQPPPNPRPPFAAHSPAQQAFFVCPDLNKLAVTRRTEVWKPPTQKLALTRTRAIVTKHTTLGTYGIPYTQWRLFLGLSRCFFLFFSGELYNPGMRVSDRSIIFRVNINWNLACTLQKYWHCLIGEQPGELTPRRPRFN